MNDQVSQSYGAVAATSANGWLTASFVLIAIGVALALFVLVWGARLAARRRQARAELEDRGELQVADAPEPIATLTPPPSAPEAPRAVAEPGPLDDTPIAAAAPVAAASASLAADTNAEPAPAADGDDLTRLKGVGPKLAARLNELGVTRFAQIAALDADAALALDAQLGNFQGRMTRDRWIEQARFLAAGDVAGYEAVFGKL